MHDTGLEPSATERRNSTSRGPAPRLTERTLPRESLPAPVATPGSRADQGSVTVVTGSAGAGKTTLMASWSQALAARGDGVGWVTLGGDDNDPASLTMALLNAVHDAIDAVPCPPEGGLHDRTRPASAGTLDPGHHDGHHDDHQLDHDHGNPSSPSVDLISRVAAAIATVGSACWLLLDDVHLVRDPRALETLETLLHRAPPDLHVVLAARADPDLRLSRLRLQERLREVRDRDLRFSRDETAAVVELHGIRLDGGQVTRLHCLTEGWAAGVGLAALSLGSGRDPESFLSAFAQDDGAVGAYLVDEVLASIDDDRREFMLDTCVTDDLPEALAVRLSGRDDAGRVLAQLTATNSLLTLVPDTHPAVYRYHSLLRSYLRARLRAESVQRSNLKHAQAAVWFAEQGQAAEAVDHAVGSGDAELARAALHRYAVGLLLDGDHASVERAVTLVPHVVSPDPALLAVAAVASLQSGDLAAARRHVAGAGGFEPEIEPRGKRAEGDGRAAHWLGTTGPPHLTYVPLPPERLIAIADWTAAQFDSTVGEAPSVVPTGPLPRPSAGAPNLADLEVLEQLQLAFALASSGRPAESIPLFEQSLRGARRRNRAFSVLSCLTGLTAANGVAGELVESRRWADEAIAYATPRGLAESPTLLLPYVCAAEAAHEHYDLDRAEELVGTALAIIGLAKEAPEGTPAGAGERDAVVTIVRSLRAVAACVAFARVGSDPACQREMAIRRLEEVRRLPPAPYGVTLVGYELITLHRMALVTAQLPVAEAVEELASSVPALAADLLAMRGVRALRLGHDRDARSHVSPVVRGELHVSVAASAVAAALVEVTVAQRNRQSAVAHEALLVALALTAEQDGLRMMLDVSADVLNALQAGRGRFGRHERLVDRLIETAEAPDGPLGPSRSRQTVGPGSAPLLSPRELSLLSDLPSLLTVSEIAQARSVSPNTIKTQLRSLFEKLEVSTRRDAVAAGRREGLI